MVKIIKESVELIKNERFQEAFDRYDFILESTPSNKNFWRAKGDLLWELEEYDNSLLCNLIAEQLESRDNFPQRLMDKFRNISENITTKIVEKLSKDPDLFEIIVSKFKEKEEEQRPSQDHYQLAMVLARKLQQSPNDPKLLYQMALTNVYLHNYQEALSYLDQMKEQQELGEEVRYQHLLILIKMKEYEKALLDADSLVARSPNDPNYLEILGDINSRLRNLDTAIDCYSRSFRNDRTNIGALFKKGVLLGRSGKLDLAFKIYDQVAKFKAGAKIDLEEISEEEEKLPKTVPPESINGEEVLGGSKQMTAREDVQSLPPTPTPKVNETQSPTIEPDVTIVKKKAKTEAIPEPEESFDPSKFPLLAKMKPDDIEFVHESIENILEKRGAGAYLYIEPQFIFEFSILILVELIRAYKMKGVMVSIDKPARIYQKIINNALGSKRNDIFYVDFTGKSKTLNDDNILNLENDFNLDHLEESIELGLHQTSLNYSGQRYFVMVDNLASLQYYASARKIRKFSKNFILKLKDLHISGYFLIGDGQMSFQLTDMIKELPKTIFQGLRRKK